MDTQRMIGGRYGVLQILGKGGMGDVYLAEDRKLPRRVAIKSIRVDLSKDAEMRKRLERESQLHARIGPHTHIVTLYDFIEENDQIHLVMEYVEGENLQDFLAKISTNGQGMPLDGALAIVDQTLDALACIHKHNIVHRDIKPGNLLLTRDDGEGYRVKLMDFGIARREADDESSTNITRADARSPGTPLYMAPEQIDPRTFGKVCPATDFYAVGIMLYQILSGRPPFKGTLTEIYNAHLNSPPPDLPDLPDKAISKPLNDLLKKALAKKPANRFTTADEFRKALARVSGTTGPRAGISLPQSDPMATMLESDAQQTAIRSGQTQLSTTGKTTRGGVGSRTWLAAAAIVLVGAGGGAAWMMLGSGGSESGAEPAAVTQEEAPVKDAVAQDSAPPASNVPAMATDTSLTQNPATQTLSPDTAAMYPAQPASPSTAIPVSVSDPPLTANPIPSAAPDRPAASSSSSALKALQKNRADEPAAPIANNEPVQIATEPPPVIAQEPPAAEPEPVKAAAKPPATAKKPISRANNPPPADPPATKSPAPAAKSGAGSWDTTTTKKKVEKITPN